MIKSAVRRISWFGARIMDAIARRLSVAATFLRLGPRRFGQYREDSRSLRESSAIASHATGATFANGLTTTLTSSRAEHWHRLYWKPLVIVLYGDTDQDINAWVQTAAVRLHARVLVSPELGRKVHPVSEMMLDIAGEHDAPLLEYSAILDWMHRAARRWDLVMLDASEPLPHVQTLVEMQHAAHAYHNDGEIGFVTPAYRDSSGRLAAGYEVDRGTRTVEPSGLGVRDYGQARLPRYVLTAPSHGLYITSAAVDSVDIAERHLRGLELDQQAGRVIRQGWAGNLRTLCMSTAVFDVGRFAPLELRDEPRKWFSERLVTDVDGRVRVVFVLNATSVSGGIRIVFELANGLSERGFDVEIWALEEAPVWFDLRVPLRHYHNYDDLLLSLRNVDAIKVATWWETAQVVWLASVNHGLPVYLIQEFETWFYPDDPVAQAAVVSSYRREFISLTEASYQQAELAEVGVRSHLIPNGYDEIVFKRLPEIQRDTDSVLALGRSFFQKNFAMTAEAWLLLGDARPNLVLFGGEPDILVDARVTYHERPTDEEVNLLYNSAAVFIQTSRHEGFCLPILEAMAAGAAVITTDSHGNRDFCRDGENCIVVPQDDPGELARAIRHLLDDPAERRRLADNALRTAESHTWSRILDRVSEFYSDLARECASADSDR